MVAILLLALVLLAPTAEAHQPSQLEEIFDQTRPLRLLGPAKPLKLLAAEYPAPSMEDISWHASSQRRVEQKPDSQLEGDRGFDARAPMRVHNLQVSAYTSRVRETDDTPFETASGKRVRWGIVASNKFPLGTKLRLPELFGHEIFVVEDCMNERYRHRVDVWMPRLTPALKFGVKSMVKVEVVEYGNRRMCYS